MKTLLVPAGVLDILSLRLKLITFLSKGEGGSFRGP